MFEEISSFSKVIDVIDENQLLVLDIDETVLQYTNINPEYWNTLFSSNYGSLKNYDLAEQKTNDDWEDLVKKLRPMHTDREGFFDLLKKAKHCSSDVIYLTARQFHMESETIEHFEELGIPSDSMIFFNAFEKGEKLRTIVGAEYKFKIIFVDDLETNLISVKNEFGDQVKCFKYVLKN
jgi:predicted secreted acid phosphatase